MQTKYPMIKPLITFVILIALLLGLFYFMLNDPETTKKNAIPLSSGLFMLCIGVYFQLIQHKKKLHKRKKH